MSVAQNDIMIIPKPVSVELKKGTFTLLKSSKITFNNPDSKNTVEVFINQVNTSTGYKLKAKNDNNGAVQFNLLSDKESTLGKEGYRIDVSESGIVVTANENAGLYYAIQSLIQLFPPEIESKQVVNRTWTIPAVSVLDYPRFSWRGIMLDVSRNFFSKEEVKEYIDKLSKYKYNTFHWHLTDDEGWRIEIKSLPKLTEVGAWRVPRYGRFGSRQAPQPGEKATHGGYYTQEDIKEIIAYAQERFITIIPEIDVPGHSMAAIAAYPELSTRKDTSTVVSPGMKFSEWYGNGTFKMLVENTLNPSDEKVYEFLDKVFTEVAQLFPSDYIHVGGDECYKGYWKEDPGCNELMKKLNIRHVEDLQGYFMGRVEEILQAKGKKMLGWDEILEGGISPGATVMSWRGIKGGIEAAKMGHDVVMTPTTFAYLDYNQGEMTIDPPIYAQLRVSKSYGFDPVPEGVDAKYILGGQGNLWTEHIPTLRYAEYMTFPRAWALAEVYWSQKKHKNWDDFSHRMEKHFIRSDFNHTNYAKAVYDAEIYTSLLNGKMHIIMNAELKDLDIYYTLDDTMPDLYSKKYKNPVEVPDGPITLRAITYRNGKPVGHLITLSLEQLKNRIR
ncbi:MAG: family 20 glycosylhydrolase [Cyclobacteriaceae bacterium]|nr:family 20 glycosylhydrolase [Cyclobacteriaceae bacterium]